MKRAPTSAVSCTHTRRRALRCPLRPVGCSPLSQTSLFPLASIGYHDYEGVALNAEEKPRLVADLGARAFLILRNHGLLTAGATIADAFLYMYLLETACQTQLLAQSAGCRADLRR